MTTHELAKKLLEGPDKRVVVDGYEGGYHDLHPDYIRETFIYINVSPRETWWDGPHGCDFQRQNNEPGESVILLERGYREDEAAPRPAKSMITAVLEKNHEVKHERD